MLEHAVDSGSVWFAAASRPTSHPGQRGERRRRFRRRRRRGGGGGGIFNGTAQRFAEDAGGGRRWTDQEELLTGEYVLVNRPVLCDCHEGSGERRVDAHRTYVHTMSLFVHLITLVRWHGTPGPASMYLSSCQVLVESIFCL